MERGYYNFLRPGKTKDQRLGDFIAVNWGVSHLKALDFSVKQER